MKKLRIIMLLLVLCLSCITPLQAKEKTLPDDRKIRLVNVTADGSYEIVKEADSYAEAKVSHTLLQKQYENLGIARGQRFLSIEYGVVAFSKANDCSINITYTNTANNEEGYTNGCYGADGAFLEYNDGNGKVKFQLSGVTAWTALENVTIYPISKVPNVSSFQVKDGKLRHFLKSEITSTSYDNTLELGNAPSYLKENTTYYSYDTHYFYSEYNSMIDDLRDHTHTKAINAKDPYYNYYQYISHRTTTNYHSEDVAQYLKDTRGLRNTITSFQDSDNSIHDILSQSMIVQGESAFFQYQNQFGSNAIMMLALALNESASGRSALSYSRNNLFGHAAYDSDVEKNASRYSKVSDSVYSHAARYISGSYLDPQQFQYHGGQFGNKAGGMNVQYASDPYWGEKAAQYYYSMDQSMKEKDLNQYAFGITGKQKTDIKKDPKTDATTLYTIEKGSEVSLVLLDTQKEGDTIWYLVQSDVPLTKDRAVSNNNTYDFKKSYGYVKAEDFVQIINSNKLEEKIYVDIHFDANGGTFYPKDKTITLQVESGSLPVVLAPEKKDALFLGWDKELTKADQEMTYTAKYRDVRSISLIEKPKTEYTKGSYLDVSKGKIEVSFADGKTEEKELTTDMVSGYDRTALGEQTLTIHYAGKDLPYKIQVKEKTASTAAKLQENAAFIIKNYSDKTGLNDEAMNELTNYRSAILQEEQQPLSNDQLRAVDRILQPNLKPRMSVIIKDDTYDLQISGLGLALQEKDFFLNGIMPKTVVVKLRDAVDTEDKDFLKKIAAANYMKYEDSFTISGKNDLSGYDPQTEVLYSIKKPANNKNKLYRVLSLEGDDVRQLATSQSESRILFKAKKGSFAIVSIQESSIKGTTDFTEVNTIQGNGKNYITTYLLIPGVIVLLLVSVMITLLCIRRNNIRKHRKKKALRNE